MVARELELVENFRMGSDMAKFDWSLKKMNVGVDLFRKIKQEENVICIHNHFIIFLVLANMQRNLNLTCIIYYIYIY